MDESDVYVDVHKAIRRLTPAPRAKRHHHEAAAATAATAAATMAARKSTDNVLVDIAEHPDGQSFTVGSLGAQSDSGAAPEQNPRTAIFMKRRSSAGLDGKLDGGTVPVKASLDEMRQQLRLGPANRAAKPRNNTRTNVFKIKQGLGVTTVIPKSGNGKLNADEHDSAKGLDDSEVTPLLPKEPTTNGTNGGQPEAGYGSGGAKKLKKVGRDGESDQ